MFSVSRWRQSRQRDKQIRDDAARVRGDAEARRALLAGRDEEGAWLEAVLFEADPIGLDFEDNTDEYRSEAQTILLRLHEAASKEGVRRIVHEEFVAWFDDRMAGPPERYEQIARTIWLRFDPSQQNALPAS